jgi:hypothetical protein
MAKKEFRKDFKEESLDFSKLDPGLEPSGEIKPKMNKLLSRVLSIIKLTIGLCLLVFVYAGSAGLLKELALVDKNLQEYFWLGVISFVLIYLFIYEPLVVYQKGQKLLGIIFKFFAPLVKFAPYVLPIYTILIFCLYPLFYLFWKTKELTGIFIFLGSFSLMLHLVFSAKSLRGKQDDFLKSNYIFGFSWIYILNLLLLALCLNLIIEKFSFISFFNGSYLSAKTLLAAIIKQIFVLD